MTRVFITGTAGFIGYHLAELLLAEGMDVHGLDGMTDYYDVALKRRRHQMLLQHEASPRPRRCSRTREAVYRGGRAFRPDVIVHLAAQAGVRYSIENPRTYIDANVTGTFNVLEAARERACATSSWPRPHRSTARTRRCRSARPTRPTPRSRSMPRRRRRTRRWAMSMPISGTFPTTMFRFFTVYGPWGRPDLALFKFTDAILDGRPIDIYNHGEMYRDFTHVRDLVRGIRGLMDAVPERPRLPAGRIPEGDSLSPVAPFRIVNIGNSEKVKLLDFVDAIEEAVGPEGHAQLHGHAAGRRAGDLGRRDAAPDLTGYRPQTDFRAGRARVRRLVPGLLRQVAGEIRSRAFGADLWHSAPAALHAVCVLEAR
jgi:UDP-glucuronate 4-epimerase